MRNSGRQTDGLGPVVGRSALFIGPRNLLLWAAWYVKAKVLRWLHGLKHWLMQQL